MPTPIVIRVGERSWSSELRDTPTARALIDALPIEGAAQVWGDEIYFSTPVTADLEEDAQAEVAVGDLAYWPPGQALCLFFGPTPASVGNEPRAASPVNVVGCLENAEALRGVADGTPVRLSRAS